MAAVEVLRNKRIANQPVEIPSGVDVAFKGNELHIKGKNGSLSLVISDTVEVKQADGVLNVSVKADTTQSHTMAGTTRALTANMVEGVSKGFQKTLQMIGTGYRANAQGKTLKVEANFSHDQIYKVPEGVTVATPTQTEIVVSGADKQLVGQVAAEIRQIRPPEPYKGKGIRYKGEQVRRKETKKAKA